MDALENEPAVYPALYPVWNAFIFLHARRASGGMGLGAIAIADIREYLDLFGVTGRAERVEWAMLISAADNAYRQTVYERDKDARK